MFVEKLRLENFRNFEGLELDFDNGVFLITGNNGHGKTNLLESLYFIASANSFRADVKDMIKRSSKHFTVNTDIQTHEITRNMSGFVDQNGRKILKINNKKTNQTDFVGEFLAVLFKPDDVEMINTEPAKRRKYLDLLISMIDYHYRETLLNYRRVLNQRNHVLYKIKEGVSSLGELEVWNISLINEGSKLLELRLNIIEKINQKLSNKFRDITGLDDQLVLNYLSSVDLEDDIKQSFYKSLYLSNERDFKDGTTTIGPHRDDFEFILSGQSLAKTGSRGEFRAVIMSLKICELELIEERTHNKPVLLLDDIFSEFDEDKRMYLFSLINNYQTLITSAEDRSNLGYQIKNSNNLHIKEGKLELSANA